MEFDYSRGQRLIVELKDNQIFEGDCLKTAKNRIDLSNVSQYPDGKLQQGNLSFYRLEIVSVRVLHQTDDVQDEKLTFDSSNSQQKEKKVDSPPRQVIALLKDEYDRLLEMTKNYIYMATVDNRYLDAIEHLNNCETIGVVGIDSKYGRSRHLSLLVLCSWDQVYLFDLKLYRKKGLEPDLEEILKSNEIKKVVHDSRKLTDCLWYCHKVRINNIFDTMVADLTLEKNRTGQTPETTRNISECLGHYLNFPSSLLENALTITTEEWEDRPLLNSRKIRAAQLATFLITLKEKQEKMLLKRFYDAVDVFSHLSVNSSGYDLQKSPYNKSDVPDEIKDHL
ncbi:hypothetical protein ILUMI_25466 [Ignelater luminosus]|uniref:3'-5' exonuclease domain-containing protein n=1 Tax=Ignelater luminosus TaxID=2038154 RepID=A0A8K0C8G9_IGNLU|nr:hypothetical protein ILUMI_25466 [Ignelater luminosus]